MEKAYLRIEGMTCVNCAKAIEVSLKKIKGIERVEVSFEVGRCYVEYREEFLSLEDIIRVIEGLGYKVASHSKKRDFQRDILIFSFISGFLIMLLMMWDDFRSLLIQAFFSVLVQIIAGHKFYKGAYAGLRAGIGNMDLLVALGTTSALLYSFLALLKILPGSPFFETNVFLISFIRLGKYIEEKAKSKALHLLKELFSIQTAKIRLLTKEGEKEASINDVLPGDILVFKPGDLIPLDCELVEGTLEVDEALVSGESEPIYKKEGDLLLSGSLIINGYGKAKVKALLEKSYISMLIKMVDEALTHKPPIQRMVDRISHYFVQIIILLSIILFFFWYLKSSNLVLSFNFSLAVLMISCPCALGIAIPLAISVGLVRSYKRGLLIKDPAVFEKAPLIKILILDKTGTLTKGQPKIISFKEYEKEVLSYAYSLAKLSRHPSSKAIVDFAKEKKVNTFEFKNFKEVPGEGIYGDEFFLGKDPQSKKLVLKRGQKLLAEFLLEDEIREDAKEIFEEFKKYGLEVVLASGDTLERVKKVADYLEIKKIQAEVKPEDKLKIVEEYQNRGYKVGMVGDGLNDAPALAKADLSFVMAEGTDLSKRVGDIILLSGLKGLKSFFQLSYVVKRRILQNLFWAFLYNFIGIPIAGGLLYSYGIILKPEMAGLMMALSSISVVLNSVRKY